MTRGYTSSTDSYSTDSSSDDERSGQNHLALVCIDGQDRGVKALDWYLDHYHQNDRIVGLVTVYTTPQPPTSGPVYPAQLHAKYQAWSGEVRMRSECITHTLEGLCLEKGLPCETFVLEKRGSVGQTICELAREKGAEVIVLGERCGDSTPGRRERVEEHVRQNTHASVLFAPM